MSIGFIVLYRKLLTIFYTSAYHSNMSYNATSKLSQKILDGELSLYGECDTIGDGIPLYPGTTKKDIMDLRDKFVPRPSNIFVTSYQRSGTNWISYIIQLICNNGVTPDKDLDQFSVCIDDMTLKEFEVSSATQQ